MKSDTERDEISVELLRELLTYDPVSGKLRWLPRRPEHFADRAQTHTAEHLSNSFNVRFVGALVGSVMKGGYLSTKIFGQNYLCHRLAFALETGAWPSKEIDHINGNASDNSWENLREVSHIENGKNQRCRSGPNSSGVIGVDFHQKSQKWRARITVNRAVRTIGSFETLRAAAAARKVAEQRYGFHPNHGRVTA